MDGSKRDVRFESLQDLWSSQEQPTDEISEAIAAARVTASRDRRRGSRLVGFLVVCWLIGAGLFAFVSWRQQEGNAWIIAAAYGGISALVSTGWIRVTRLRPALSDSVLGYAEVGLRQAVFLRRLLTCGMIALAASVVVLLGGLLGSTDGLDGVFAAGLCIDGLCLVGSAFWLSALGRRETGFRGILEHLAPADLHAD